LSELLEWGLLESELLESEAALSVFVEVPSLVLASPVVAAEVDFGFVRLSVL
jgi:hypothetical protein